MQNDSKSQVEKDNIRLIEYLESALQQQRGMLWLLGEIMKEAVNIDSFKQLMAVLTDMLMGVMGVTTCYIWLAQDRSNEEYKTYFRSVSLHNEFHELDDIPIPECIADLSETHKFTANQIKTPMLEQIDMPKSRLAVPLTRFDDDSVLGMLVLEHEQENFFNNNSIVFFETLAVFVAINAQNLKILEDVSKESVTDPLTGIYNRRHLKKIIEKMSIQSKHITVAIIDTDNFKTINDTLGHLKGDEVLKGIAKLARGSIKECGGQIVRYGGDEFVIAIPLKLADALILLEEFRDAVQYIQIAYDLERKVSVTLGVCAYPDQVDDPYDAIQVADRALLRGKAEGKNRIVRAKEEDIRQD